MKLCTILLALTLCTGCAASGRSMPPTVALLTDYGTVDAYAGVLAGAVLGTCPNAKLVTITHQVPAFGLAEGSYLLARASSGFPTHTVFVAVVDPGVGTQRRSIVLRSGTGRLYVGPDNGLFTGVIRTQGLDRAWEITDPSLLRPGALSNTFHGRDIYGPVGGLLAAGMEPQRVGPAIDDPVLLPLSEPIREADTVSGQIVHVDHYGNVTTNIPAEWLAEAYYAQGRNVTVAIDDRSHAAICARTYADVPPGALLVLANAEGLVEVARNAASAAELLGVRTGGAISIHR
jgi:hypothetical protein